MAENLVAFLNKKVKEYNQPNFIPTDPIAVPHQFTKKQDIEIAGFFASIFAWGIRKTIINKGNELMQLMHHSPHDFCLNHTDNDLKKLLHFKHRTFNSTDLLYFIEFFKQHYQKHHSLETAFTIGIKKTDPNVESVLNNFYNYFFSLKYVPHRTLKHVASPAKNSACKRINMFLRWMVRQDNNGVDFGLWKKITPSQLIIPLDLHVGRVARQFNLVERKQTDWLTAVELTNALRTIDPTDPCKFDYALFALGINERF